MVQLSGTYDNGNITLDEKVSFDKPVKVVVTFMEEEAVEPARKGFTVNDFSFIKSRELLKNVKGNLSDTVIEERRSGL